MVRHTRQLPFVTWISVAGVSGLQILAASLLLSALCSRPYTAPRRTPSIITTTVLNTSAPELKGW